MDGKLVRRDRGGEGRICRDVGVDGRKYREFKLGGLSFLVN